MGRENVNLKIRNVLFFFLFFPRSLLNKYTFQDIRKSSLSFNRGTERGFVYHMFVKSLRAPSQSSSFTSKYIRKTVKWLREKNQTSFQTSIKHGIKAGKRHKFYRLYIYQHVFIKLVLSEY